MNVLEHFYLKVLPEYAQVIRETFLSIHGPANDLKIAESHLSHMEYDGYKLDIRVIEQDGLYFLYFELKPTEGEFQLILPDELLNIDLSKRVPSPPVELRLINRPLGRLHLVDKEWNIVFVSNEPFSYEHDPSIQWLVENIDPLKEIGHVIIK